MLQQVTADPFLWLVIVGAVLLAGLIMFSSQRHGDLIMSGVGGSAALFGFQVAQVHVFTIFVALWVVAKLIDHRSVAGGGYHIWLFVGASLFVASTVLVGDLVSNPKTSLQWVFLTVSASVIAVTTEHRDRMIAMRGMLAVIVLSCLYAVGQLARVLPTRADTEHLFISAIGRPTGLWPEPDWLGMYAGVGVVLALSLRMNVWLRLPIVTLCLAMWVLGFARGAWIALAATAVAAAVVYIARGGVRPNLKPQAQAIGFAAAVTAVVVLVVPELSGNVTRRLEQTFGVSHDDVSGQARLQQLDALRQLESTSPWYGHGLSAAGRVDVSGKLFLDPDWSGNAVASNWVVGLWVDAKWLAVPFIAIVLTTVFFAVWRRELAAFVALLVMASSFVSNATLQPVFWFALGCCLAPLAPKLASGQSHRGEEVLEQDRHRASVVADGRTSA